MVHSPTRGTWLRMHRQSMWVAHLGSALYKEKQPRKNGLTDGMHTAWGLDWKVNLSSRCSPDRNENLLQQQHATINMVPNRAVTSRSSKIALKELACLLVSLSCIDVLSSRSSYIKASTLHLNGCRRSGVFNQSATNILDPVHE